MGETAANASVSQAPTTDGVYNAPRTTRDNALMKEITGPSGGQLAMDAARFGQTSVLYDKKPWQPISKFHPTLQQRESLISQKKEHIAPKAGGNNADGRPTFNPKQFSWGRPSHRLDQAWYHMVLTAGDKIL